MPLVSLQSDLSWYGNTPPGFKPNANKESTDFQYKQTDLTVMTRANGFNELGNPVTFAAPLISSDAFPIDTALGDNGNAKRTAQRGLGSRFISLNGFGVYEFDVPRLGWSINNKYGSTYNKSSVSGIADTYATTNSTLFDDVNFSIEPGGSGNAKRKAQLGNGSKFPIGPNGQVHQFDTKRTGWYDTNRYGDQFNNKTLTGLANTYTAKSPIDDMYNKYKVREEVYDPYGYARSPYILRGIQREDSSDPQRWGLGGTTTGVISGLLDIPRSGPLTAAERALTDVARIGKFLIRPSGLAFIAKQQLLHLMSPNTENVKGIAVGFDAKKLYNPVNTLLTVAGGVIGGRFRRYGLLPVDVNPLTPSTYEGIHKLRNNILNPVADPTFDNRLVKLNNERTSTIGLFLPAWTPLSGPMGPDSVGGIGFTTFSKRREYDTNFVGTGLNRALDLARGRQFLTQYDSNNRYTRSDRPVDDRSILLPLAAPGVPNALKGPYDKISLYNRVNDKKQRFTGIPQREVEQAASNETRIGKDVSRYKTLSYGQIPNRKPNAVRTFDFEEGEEWDDDTIPTLESKYGYTKYDPASKRGGNANAPLQDQPDLINSIPIGSDYAETTSDLIKFRFAPIKATNLEDANGNIIFRAYLTDLSDNFAPNWEGVQDQGRADAKVRYTGFERTIDCGFKVVVHSAGEAKIVWDKLAELAKITYPVYAGNGFHGVYVKVTIGDLYVNQPMYITSLSYNWDVESPWEIDEGKQLPFYTDVNMSLTWIGEKRPNYNDATIFSYNIR